MFGSEILEVAVGIGFLYLLLSLVCSAITEGIARAFAMRSGTLRSGIRNLLGDPQGEGLAKAFYNHPLIKGLYSRGWFDRMIGRDGKPSYISPRTFALALFDTLVSTDPEPDNRDYSGVRSKVEKIQKNDDLKRALLVCMDDAEEDLGRARKNVERWFEEAMERVIGWYRRKTQLIIVCVAATVSVALNVDSFAVTNALWNDAALRDSVVAAAQRNTGQALGGDLDIIEERLGGLGLPLGWRVAPEGLAAWSAKISGLLFTTVALSLGAPFWFDLLNRFMGVGSSGRSPNMPSAPNPPKT
jgi:hypothetical protein